MTEATLSGALGAGNLAEILSFLAATAKTGRLTVELAPELGLTLKLRGGRVAGVGGPLAPRLGDALMRLAVSKDRIAALWARWSAGEGPESLARAFPELEAAQEQRVRIALSYALASSGRFHFREEAPASPWGVHLGEALLEALRGLDERATPLRPLEVYGLPRNLGVGLEGLRQLLPQDWQVLATLDGERTAAQIGAFLVLPWDELAGRLERLLGLGLAELCPEAPSGGWSTQLKEGDPAPNFTLLALDGTPFSLGSLVGQKVLLAFFRHGGCPWCNLRVHELIQNYPQLKARGVEVVGVFGSPLETLRTRVGRQNPPFPILADPDDAVHTLYGVGLSLWGLLDPRALPDWIRGLSLGIPHGSVDGELLRMPAEFLLEPGLRVARAYYGKNPADHLPLEEVMAPARGAEHRVVSPPRAAWL
ncbi:MAG: alkyl hydroperoxide reductase [Meiothermus sp.]